MSVSDNLRRCADIFEERKQQYGDRFLYTGDWVAQFIKTCNIDMQKASASPAETNRMLLLVNILNKLDRYAVNYHNGGHEDSLDDLAVYCAMLNQVDAMLKEKANAK